MSKKTVAIALVLLFVFALGFGFSLSVELAYAGPVCNCPFYCADSGEWITGILYSGKCNYWPACGNCDPH